MMQEAGIAAYRFLVEVCSNDENLVSNFGYSMELKFQEQVTREIMKALAGIPNVILASVDPIVSLSREDEVETEEVESEE